MEAVGAIVTVTGLIAGVTKIANAVNNIKERWQNASLNISMVSTSLWAVKAALEEIAEWRQEASDGTEQSEQLDRNLEVCVESCAVMVAVVENRLKDIDLENISKYDRARFVALDSLFKDFASTLRAQVDALKLLLTIYQCRSLSEQKKQLQNLRTKNVVTAVRQSTASLGYVDKDISDAASILSETPTTSFAFDNILMQHQNYSRTYPRLYMRMQKNFPSRQGSVTSNFGRNHPKSPQRSPPQSPRKSPSPEKKRAFPVDDPIISQNISLPFLGVPFHGESSFDQVAEQKSENASMSELNVATTVHQEGDGLKALLDIPATKESEGQIQSITALQHHSPQAKNVLEATEPSRSMQEATSKDVDTPKEQSAEVTSVVHSNLKVLNAAKQNRESFDSLYDISDDEKSDTSDAKPIIKNEENQTAAQHDQIQARTPDLLSSIPKTSDDTTEIDKHTQTLQDQASTTPDKVSDIQTDNDISKLNQSNTSGGKAVNNVSYFDETETHSFVSAEQHLEQENESAKGQAKGFIDSGTSHVPEGVPSSLLVINFGDGPDLNITPHTPKTEESEVATYGLRMATRQDSDSTTIDLAAAQAVEESDDLATPRDASAPHTLLLDQPFQAVIESPAPDSDEPIPQAPVIDTSGFIEDSFENPTAKGQEMFKIPSPQYPPPPIPSQADNIIYNQPQTLVTQRRSVHNDPTAIAAASLDPINNDGESRHSFQSDNSRNIHVPASPISVQSQHPPSSMTSTGSSYTSRDLKGYYTPGTSVFSAPPPLSPRTVNDRGESDKKLSAIKNSLNKLKTGVPTTNRLSAMTSKLHLKLTSEKNLKAKELANMVQTGDAIQLAAFVQSYDRAADISVPTAIQNETQEKTALMRAAALDNFGCVEVLLSHDPTGAACADKQGNTALHHALLNQSWTTALWLVSQLGKVIDGQLQFPNKDGQTLYEMPNGQGVYPVHLAAKGPLSILELLHKMGANFGAIDPEGSTVLHYAVSARNLDDVRYLIRQGLADVNVKDAKGETPLMRAAAVNSWNSLHFMLEHGAKKDMVDNEGNTALHHGASHGHISIVETLFQSIEDITAKNHIGEQPLHLAAAGNHTEVLTALLNIPGIQVNCWTEPPHLKSPIDRKQGFAATARLASTPLHYACASGHHEAADILIGHAAMVNSNQEDGYSLLMMACQAQNSAVVSLLLLNGADPKGSTEKEGLTALHIACKCDDLPSTKLLIEYGADTLATLNNKNKDTASALAYRENPMNARSAATYAMRYRMHVLRATNSQYAPLRVYNPNVRQIPQTPSVYANTQYPHGMVPSQYGNMPQYPPTSSVPYQGYHSSSNEPPPPPYQR